MLVFKNSLGFNQHHRLMVEADSLDLGNGGGGVNTPEPNPHDSPDINGEKGNDINDNNNGNNGGASNDNDNPDNNSNKGKEEQDGNSSTGELEPGTNIEFDGNTYTVDDKGNVVDDKGNIFKEAKDVKAWVDSLSVDNDDDDNQTLSIESIQKAIGEEIVDEDGKPVEFTNDVAGVKSYIDNVISLRSSELQTAAVNKVFADNPILAQFANYLAVNGSPRGFGELPDRSGITIDADNEQQQIAIIKAAAAEFGNNSLNDNYIKYLKDSGGLYDEAKAQLTNLQNADKQRNEEFAIQAEEQRKAEQEATDAYWSNVHAKLAERKIGQYTLPETFVRETNGQKVTVTLDDFFNYLYRQTPDKDGNSATEYQRYLAAQSEDDLMNKEMLDAWLAFTGGSYKDLVNMAIKEEKVKTLRLKSKNNDGHKTIKFAKPTNNKDKVDIDNLLLGF